MEPFARAIDAAKKYVVSSTLDRVDWNAELVRGDLGKAENPYWAVLACPSCGSLGLITRQQCAGLETMICGSSECSAEYFLEDQTIRYRLAN